VLDVMRRLERRPKMHRGVEISSNMVGKREAHLLELSDGRGKCSIELYPGRFAKAYDYLEYVMDIWLKLACWPFTPKDI
jgi:hypothetical protein